MGDEGLGNEVKRETLMDTYTIRIVVGRAGQGRGT